MNHVDFEILLSDYIDGTLDAATKLAFEQHRAECAPCAEFARDAMSAVAFIGRAEEVTPPPELLTRITFGIPRKALKPANGFRGLFERWLQPVLQPRIAMGMAMTILSFSMLGRFAGIEVRDLKPSDLNPAKIWMNADDRAHRMWARALMYYDSLRVVYEVQSRLKEWTEQDEQEGQTQSGKTNKPADPVKSTGEGKKQ
jgi:anti-sigma factor RsiW